VFAEFRLDLPNARLWRAQEIVHLYPKTFAVLDCLVARAGQLVTKDTLLEAVWPEAVVSEAVLQVAIRELRRVLGDQARTPQFIETVHGRGYRFIASVRALVSSGRPALPGVPRPAPPPIFRAPPYFVGRNVELTQLTQWFTTACQGTLQVGIIAGEPGIGKTALVETFVSQVAARADVWVGHGQCIESYGVGEPYLPLLEALGRLCRDAAGATLLPVLRQYAPSWLVHLPALLPPEEREHLAHTASGVTPTRMLWELAEALEVLTAARPLVLVLEDLHWSDRATLEWLAYMVRRRDPACLLILGTYRPVEVIVRAHPLRPLLAELQQQAQCVELVLDYLSTPAVAAYLTQRFATTALPADLPQLLHQRTSGHPLFLVAMVDELVRQKFLETGDNSGGSQGAVVLREVIPTSLRQYIEQHIEQLSAADQAFLEAASVAGSTFAVAAVAAGVAQAPETIEARYTALARQEQFIRASGIETWPDGTVTACYQFMHTLYHEVVYARVSAGHRVRLHQQIGLRKEAGYGVQARRIAAELAVHFARGHDAGRAVHYLHYVGENALRRGAYQEAITHLTRGLEVLARLPDTAAWTPQELTLRIALGHALIATRGYAAPEVGHTYARARALCHQGGDTPELVSVLYGIYGFYATRAEYMTARQLGEECLRLAQRQHDPGLRLQALLQARCMIGITLFFLGEFVASRTHTDQAIALYVSQQHCPRAWQDHGVIGLIFAAWALWSLGHPDQALRRSQEALTLAREYASPRRLVWALIYAAGIHLFWREPQRAHQLAEEALALATAQGFLLLTAAGMFYQGGALAMQEQHEEGLARLRQGLAMYQTIEAGLGRSLWLALLAEATGNAGQVAEGLALVAEARAWVDSHAERFWEAELLQLQGRLLLQRASPDAHQAEACFQQALDIARRQQAKSFELRAAMRLSRLWQHQGRQAEAHELLFPIYNWFTEGFDTADLREAKALLEELA
jgi:DNA-binding winged helix-turn-helix (wHTH) protein/predicted ATPase